uniref:(northern house mosquito) hypothetical protein n=1 Tax=Culex pipiens TaxID=7175 RepID=A0A8D8JCN9_CULPI
MIFFPLFSWPSFPVSAPHRFFLTLTLFRHRPPAPLCGHVAGHSATDVHRHSPCGTKRLLSAAAGSCVTRLADRSPCGLVLRPQAARSAPGSDGAFTRFQKRKPPSGFERRRRGFGTRRRPFPLAKN